MRRLAGLLAIALVPMAVLFPSSAHGRDATVTSFDGTKIAVHFFPVADLEPGRRRPVVLLAHGFAERGPSAPDTALAGAPRVSSLLAAGYNVLTWDARGHGDSGGTAMFDSPDFEVRDTQALIDWVASQPEVELDGPGDPRLGMTGSSYGGIIQYLTAALDDRVDVITPGYTAYSLSDTTISRYGKFKEGWGLGLAGMAAANVPAGLVSPLGPYLHLLDPVSVQGVLESVATGVLSDGFRAYLDERSPSTYLSDVHVPTLVQGGTSDTLFPLVNAIRDYTVLQDRGVPVKMSWNCEGHSLCPGSPGPLREHFESLVINWFDRWLDQRPAVRTGAPFSWIADNESVYREAASFPPPVVGTLTGRASGSILIAPTGPPTSLGFLFIGAQPAVGAMEVPIAPPAQAADVVGHPTVRLSYRGLAFPAKTWVYGQILDAVTGRVVGVQVTPIPVTLDGRQRAVEVELEAIATRALPTGDYRLQLMPASLLYGLQRSLGSVTVSEARVTLPVIDPT
ncbi:MAG TPA: CocE/NonD family hydrolase [Nocardioidaceae bacterium]|nr:CocE/NonD family hydrolase [Nocardioidaceae bacterium]